MVSQCKLSWIKPQVSSEYYVESRAWIVKRWGGGLSKVFYQLGLYFNWNSGFGRLRWGFNPRQFEHWLKDAIMNMHNYIK